MKYSELLLTVKWLTVKQNILERDKYCCRRCKISNIMLHVHHVKYIKDWKSWEYPDELLLTLCDKCHMWIHDNILIGDFYLLDKKYKKRTLFITRV